LRLASASGNGISGAMNTPHNSLKEAEGEEGQKPEKKVR
jgi:hypothetical protein